MGYRWKPLQRGKLEYRPEATIVEAMRLYNLPREEAIAKLDEYDKAGEIWLNDLYQVTVHRYPENLVHINIRRRDGNACLRDWRHFQLIKNQLVGPECEAVELFPAESRLVDSSNKYHLWAISDPAFRFPVGFSKRDVQDEQPGMPPGMKQRKF